MIKYTFHLLLCDIEGIKITEGITKKKTLLLFAFFTQYNTKVMDCLLICLQFLFSIPHSISVILLLHAFDIRCNNNSNKKKHIKIINLNKI